MSFNSSSAQLSCSSCGAPLGFESKASVYIVCKYCNTSQLRKDASLETIGKISALKEDYSVIQIGTQGVFDSKRFGVFGRIRLKWQRGTWDEWFIVFEDNSVGWLAEAQGFYYLSKPIDLDISHLAFPLSMGTILTVDQFRYRLKDIKNAECIYSEGELPFNGAVGEHYESYDLFTPDGKFVGISKVEEGAQVFKGEAYSFVELELSNLRALEGWSVNG